MDGAGPGHGEHRYSGTSIAVSPKDLRHPVKTLGDLPSLDSERPFSE
jgi:hypothetical protein